MSCARLASLLVFVAIPVARSVAAESSPAAGNSSQANSDAPAAEASPSSESPKRARGISPGMAAQLTALTPKFDPAVAAAKDTKPAEPAPDLREIDKPKNTIIRLPDVYVREDRVRVPKEREVRTPKATLEEALRRHPGARFGSFWIFSNHGIALAMLAEEERLEKKREFEDLAGLMRITDPAAGAKAKHDVQQAFLREADFGR